MSATVIIQFLEQPLLIQSLHLLDRITLLIIEHSMKKFIVFIIGALLLIPLLLSRLRYYFPYQGGTGFQPQPHLLLGIFADFFDLTIFNLHVFECFNRDADLATSNRRRPITLNQIQFAGGTSTAAFTIQGLLTAPTGSFTYTDAATTNATFATVGTLTASNATITNVSSTNMSVSSSLLVTGKAVCLADGTNCLPTTTPTLQQVATAGNTTSLALTLLVERQQLILLSQEHSARRLQRLGRLQLEYGTEPKYQKPMAALTSQPTHSVIRSMLRQLTH